MLISIQKELYKLVHKKKYAVIFIVLLVFLAARYGLNYALTRLTGGSVTIRTSLPLEILPLLTDFFVPIIIFMAVTDLTSDEMRENTLKLDFLRPVTRECLIFSKAAATAILALAYLTAAFFTACLMQLIAGGIRHGLGSFAAYILDIVPAINLIFFAMIINLIVEKPALSLLLCLAGYAVLKYMSLYSGAVSSLLFTSYLRWHSFIIGASLPFAALAGKLGIIFGTMLIFGAASVIITDRKNV